MVLQQGPLFLYLELIMEKNSFMNTFPVEQFRRMVMHIDRFDTDVVEDETVKNAYALDKMDEISEKIIEDNL